ncbi:DUF2946 family protein [Pseudorhodoferax sp.]|uniref:DUF2946 family protein n=1 Tax=Pseudorhodoferax sp. TaxID=1993553 RepID=UPI0039E34B11
MRCAARFRSLAHGLIGRAALLWFGLALLAAAASPLVHPQAMELVCSAGGSVKLLVHTDDGVQEMGASHLDCAACLPAGGAPPAPAALRWPPPAPPGHALRPIVAARTASAAAAPLPARGPPAA